MSEIVPGKEKRRGKGAIFGVRGGRCRVYLKVLFIEKVRYAGNSEYIKKSNISEGQIYRWKVRYIGKLNI